MTEEINCLHCRKRFKPRSYYQRYCSHKCATAHRYQEKDEKLSEEKEPRIVRIFREFEICFNCKHRPSCDLTNINKRVYGSCDKFEPKSKINGEDNDRREE